MAADATVLDQLCACLRGDVPADADWVAIAGLANRTLTTPRLAIALADDECVPAEVTQLIEAIRLRTRARNTLMLAQLTEAAGALAQHGIAPVLIKGAASLAPGGEALDARISVDLDLMVDRAEGAAAVAALRAIGYADFERVAPGEGASLARERDAGGIDLHFANRARHPRLTHAQIVPHCREIALGSATALLPSPTMQAALLILHDQVQERDYWRGLIDLRHLLDLRDLAGQGGLDGTVLHALFPAGFARRALEVQLLTLEALFGVPLPKDITPGLRARLQLRRRLFQLRHRASRGLLTLASLLLDPPLGSSPTSERDPATTRYRQLRARARYYRHMFTATKPTKA